jgi:hypothetical protein
MFSNSSYLINILIILLISSLIKSDFVNEGTCDQDYRASGATDNIATCPKNKRFCNSSKGQSNGVSQLVHFYCYKTKGKKINDACDINNDGECSYPNYCHTNKIGVTSCKQYV